MFAETLQSTRTALRPNLLPVVRQLPADLETPVSVYLKLAGLGPSFLLESVTGGEQLARFSFIGVDPRQAYVLRGRTLQCHLPESIHTDVLPEDRDPLDVLREELAQYRPLPQPGLPRFAGGLVGYLGYDAMHFFEPSVPRMSIPDAEQGLPPDAIFLLADTLIVFDHAFGRLLLIANMPLDGEGEGAEARARLAGEAKLDGIQERLAAPIPQRPPAEAPHHTTPLKSNTTQDEFMQAVLQAKEHIAAGDIFQVVLSQRFCRETFAHPFDIYRALRRLNPSPYMFFFDFDGLTGDEPLCLIGASPEMHVRLEGRRASLRPIAGTRRRGQTPAEDQVLQEDLLADPKERAEHVMLVDLARNDLGRVSRFGSVQVTDLMSVERYSHVMHIVSQVEGDLREDYDAFDLMRATFPAGTVSGAPKIRAMQIIADLETAPRRVYAGAVGYFSFDGSMDTCIAIRTLVMQGQQVCVQAGAGIVADSEPEREYQETVNKARALAVAVEMAEQAAVQEENG